jgi:hypothetical protein
MISAAVLGSTPKTVAPDVPSEQHVRGLEDSDSELAAEIGRVQAQDADEAIKIAIEQYEVAQPRLLIFRCRHRPSTIW